MTSVSGLRLVYEQQKRRLRVVYTGATIRCHEQRWRIVVRDIYLTLLMITFLFREHTMLSNV